MHVHVNCAVSLDGRLAGPGGRPVRLSGEADWKRVHRLRASVDAILVGAGTVRADDPSLRVKSAYAAGPDPRPVVWAGTQALPAARIFGRESDDQRPPTLLVGPPGPAAPDGVEDLRAPDQTEPAAVLTALEEAGIASLLVEGGAQVLRQWAGGPWDTWTIYQAPVMLQDGPTLGPISPSPRLESTALLDDGVLWTFLPSPES